MEPDLPEPLVHIWLGASLEVAGEVLPGGEHLLRQAAHQALRLHPSFPSIEMSLLVTDDEQMRSLNREFASIDAPTDVLAFPAGEIDLDSQALYLGDLTLSLPRAVAQARSAGHSIESELQLLTVHGVLHLLGYDHATKEQKKAMWQVQAEILAQLGNPLSMPGDS